jgi:hypothetical protein
MANMTNSDACMLRNNSWCARSHLRHAVEALALLLTDDFEYGALRPGTNAPECRGEGQFAKAECRQYINYRASLCSGRVKLDHDHRAWARVGPQHAAYDAVLWGGGRHPTNGTTNHGRANASLVIQDIVGPICSNPSNQGWIKGTDQGRQRLYWLNSHARLMVTRPHELPAVIKLYNEEMCSYLGEHHAAVTAV